MSRILFKLKCLWRFLFSRTVKKIYEAELPSWGVKAIIRGFEVIFDINGSEFEDRKFKSFSEYFTREFREIESQRPIGPGLVSPVDADLIRVQNLSADSQIEIKETVTSVRDFTGFDVAATEYVAVHFYLSPRNYHRVHSPLDDFRVLGSRYLYGERLMIETLHMEFLSQNERVGLILSVPQSPLPIYMVMTGAFCVGNIFATRMGTELNPRNIGRCVGETYRRGDEIGRFAFGSSVSLILPNSVFDLFIESGGSVVVGQTIAGLKTSVQQATVAQAINQK